MPSVPRWWLVLAFSCYFHWHLVSHLHGSFLYREKGKKTTCSSLPSPAPLSTYPQTTATLATLFRVGVFTDLELFGDVAGNPYACKRFEYLVNILSWLLYLFTLPAQGGMMVRNQYIKHVPKDVMIPKTSLRLLNSIGQGLALIMYCVHSHDLSANIISC